MQGSALDRNRRCSDGRDEGYLERVAVLHGLLRTPDPVPAAGAGANAPAALIVSTGWFVATVLALSPSGAAVAVLAVGVAVVAAYLVLRAGAAEQRLRLGAAGIGEHSAPVDATALAPQGPQRYRVTVHAHDGSSAQYAVVTSSDSKKAASIAFDNHTRASESDAARSEVRDVQVEHLGPAERTASGAVDFHDGDLFDRSEF